MTDAEFDAFVATLPEDERYELIERAAIHEFEGGLERENANSRAVEEHNENEHRC